MAAVAASTVALAGGGIAAVDSNVRRAVLAQHAAHPAKVAHVVDGRARPKPPPAAGPTRPVVDRSVVSLGATTTTTAARPVAVAKPKPKPAAPQEFTAPKPAPVPASAPQEFTSSSTTARPAATARSSGSSGGSSSSAAPNEFGP